MKKPQLDIIEEILEAEPTLVDLIIEGAELEFKFDSLQDEIAKLNPFTSNGIRKAPFRWICAIFVNHGKRVLPVPAQKLNANPREDLMGPWVGGTGLLISPRHVLTCGHILADRLDAKHTPKEIQIFFGTMKGSGLSNKPEFGIWSAQKAYFHPGVLKLKEWESRSYDFGLLELNSNNGVFPGEMMIDNPREQFGWWGQSGPHYFMNTHRSPDWLRSRKINVYGFPEAQERKLHHGFGDVSAVFGRNKSLGRLHPMIRYDVRTRQGVSGGPIWTLDEGPLERRLIGIHILSQNGHRGMGLLMNPDIAKFLRERGVKNKMLDAADQPYSRK